MKSEIGYKILQIFVLILLSIIQLFSFEFNIQRAYFLYQTKSNSQEISNSTGGEFGSYIIISTKYNTLKACENLSNKAHLINFIGPSLKILDQLKIIAILCIQHFISFPLGKQSALELRAPPFIFS